VLVLLVIGSAFAAMGRRGPFETLVQRASRSGAAVVRGGG